MKKIAQTDFATYFNHRKEPYFTFVKNGQKTIEGRINKGEYRFVRSGDHIIVNNEGETDFVEVLVKDVRLYSSLREMLEQEPFKKLLPEVATIEEGLEAYKRFYTSEQEKEFGVIAIEFERV